MIFLFSRLFFQVYYLYIRLIFKDSAKITYQNILLIFVLSFINLVIRNILIRLKDKYNMSARNFELVRRLSMIALLGMYFYFK